MQIDNSIIAVVIVLGFVPLLLPYTLWLVLLHRPSVDRKEYVQRTAIPLIFCLFGHLVFIMGVPLDWFDPEDMYTATVFGPGGVLLLSSILGFHQSRWNSIRRIGIVVWAIAWAFPYMPYVSKAYVSLQKSRQSAAATKQAPRLAELLNASMKREYPPNMPENYNIHIFAVATPTMGRLDIIATVNTSQQEERLRHLVMEAVRGVPVSFNINVRGDAHAR